MKLQTWVNSRSLFCPFFWEGTLQGGYLGGEKLLVLLFVSWWFSRLLIRWLWLSSTCTLPTATSCWSSLNEAEEEAARVLQAKASVHCTETKGQCTLSLLLSSYKESYTQHTHSKHGSWGKKHRHAAITKIIHMFKIICLYSKNQLWFEDSQDCRSL